MIIQKTRQIADPDGLSNGIYPKWRTDRYLWTLKLDPSRVLVGLQENQSDRSIFEARHTLKALSIARCCVNLSNNRLKQSLEMHLLTTAEKERGELTTANMGSVVARVRSMPPTRPHSGHTIETRNVQAFLGIS